MKIKGKFYISLFVFALLLGGCGKEEISQKPVVRPVKAMQVAPLSKSTGASFPGKASAAQEVNLSFRVSGPLIEFPVKVGDEVKKGELLARIDPRDFEVRLNNAAGQLERALAALKLAQKEYDRVERIRRQDPGAVSETMVDAKLESRNQAKAQVRSLEASVAAAGDALSYCTLRAPFSGTVVETFAENYEDVQAKQAVVRLVDTSKIEFTVDIPESHISLVPYVEQAFVRFDVFPTVEIPARIKEIGKEASRTTRTYPVTLVMEQPEDFRILPGMAGRARGEGWVPSEPALGVIEVPLSAVFEGPDGGDCVWVINEESQTVTRRKVKTGILTQSGLTVLEGLEAGEWIAAAGVHSLREGKPVRVKQFKRLAKQ